MKLTNIAAKSAKPKEKAYKLADGSGLYLEVFPQRHRVFCIAGGARYPNVILVGPSAQVQS
ncbi:MAG: hypothetical protein JWR07_2221 [Nevskia sp.]|nr:hypothetical protein [Nevskia sp.]